MAVDVESTIATLLRDTHELAPVELRPVLSRALAPLGFYEVEVFLADHEQRRLVPLPPAEGRDALGIDTTLPGRVYQRSTKARESGDDSRVWFPVRDGVERIGVLLLAHTSWDDKLLRACDSLAALVASLVVSKSQYTDDFEFVRRSEEMKLGAELCWSLLPPLSFSTGDVSVSAALEPSYAVSGDSFDYALNGRTLEVGIFDGMGHDLSAARTTELIVSSYRHCRRRKLALKDTYAVLDGVMREAFGPDRFVTAQLATLDTTNGQFDVLNAGHPGPLLVRDGHVVNLRGSRPALPFGLGDLDDAPVAVQTHTLQADDRLLFYTDGLTEARAADGSEFGEERLVDTVERARSETHVLAEAVRRLMHQLGAFRDHVWHDDATLVMVHWTPGRTTQA